MIYDNSFTKKNPLSFIFFTFTKNIYKVFNAKTKTIQSTILNSETHPNETMDEYSNYITILSNLRSSNIGKNLTEG